MGTAAPKGRAARLQHPHNHHNQRQRGRGFKVFARSSRMARELGRPLSEAEVAIAKRLARGRS